MNPPSVTDFGNMLKSMETDSSSSSSLVNLTKIYEEYQRDWYLKLLEAIVMPWVVERATMVRLIVDGAGGESWEVRRGIIGWNWFSLKQAVKSKVKEVKAKNMV